MPASGAQIWVYINRQTKGWLTMINLQITWNITRCLGGCWLVWSRGPRRGCEPERDDLTISNGWMTEL